MIAPYDHEALWIKAKLFMNRAMDNDETRSFDEQALWASLALELLGKAALARVSPLLIAEPTEDGLNILIASGLVAGEARFNSVRASTIFKRCQKAFKPFSQREASRFSEARNEYLHGAGVGFLAIPPHIWWPRFWAQASVLIAALDREPEDFVGGKRLEVVGRHLEQNAKNVEHRTETLIERAKQRLAQYRSGTLPARIASEWSPGVDRSLGLFYRTVETCPACGASGTLEGENVSNTEVAYETWGEDHHEYSDYLTVVTLTIDADFFSCSTCQLVLDSYELIEQAELPTTFSADGDESDLFHEPDYGND